MITSSFLTKCSLQPLTISWMPGQTRFSQDMPSLPPSSLIGLSHTPYTPAQSLKALVRFTCLDLSLSPGPALSSKYLVLTSAARLLPGSPPGHALLLEHLLQTLCRGPPWTSTSALETRRNLGGPTLPGRCPLILCPLPCNLHQFEQEDKHQLVRVQVDAWSKHEQTVEL